MNRQSSGVDRNCRRRGRETRCIWKSYRNGGFLFSEEVKVEPGEELIGFALDKRISVAEVGERVSPRNIS